MEKMKMESLDIAAQNVEKLQSLFPSCITESRDAAGRLCRAVDFDALRALLGGSTAEGPEAYDFTWVGKNAARAEAARSVRKTLRPITPPTDSKNWDTTENLYIEGDNLDALKLLQESYLGKVKMIYIDPPYNTGHDFLYKDKFQMEKEDYAAQTELFDEEGRKQYAENNDSNPRFHSDWCSMIYPRLLLARNLLTEDGAIYISIADQEVENLKKICNEVFGETNFIGQIIWESTTQPDNIGNARYRFQQKAEYILFFAKDKKKLAPFILEKLPNSKKYPHKGKFGKCRFEIIERSFEGAYARPTMRFKILGQYPREGKQWQIGEKQARLLEAAGKLELVNGIVKRAVYPEDEATDDNFKPFWSIFSAQEVGTSQKGKALLKSLLGNTDFDTVKPVSLITKLLGYFSDSGIILDFFSGSATTAHAVMQLNAEDGGHRKFIMVQLPEACDEKSEAYKAGYRTICDIGKERIRRAGEKIQKEHPEAKLDTGFRVFRVDSTNMENVYYGAGEYSQSLLAHLISNVKPDRTDLDLFFGCVLDWGLPLDRPYAVETVAGCVVHDYDGGALLACFEESIPEEVIRAMAEKRPLRAVFRDASFAGSPARINVAEIFHQLSPLTQIKVI